MNMQMGNVKASYVKNNTVYSNYVSKPLSSGVTEVPKKLVEGLMGQKSIGGTQSGVEQKSMAGKLRETVNSHFDNKNNPVSAQEGFKGLGLEGIGEGSKMFKGQELEKNDFNKVFGEGALEKTTANKQPSSIETKNTQVNEEPSGLDTGNVEPNKEPASTSTGWKLVNAAVDWNGKMFKPELRNRCADFVSTVIEEAGVAPEGFKHELLCYKLVENGEKVEKKDMKPGDLVFFKNTWREAPYTHVGVYLGKDKFIHRANAEDPIHVESLNSPKYKDKFSAARRLG